MKGVIVAIAALIGYIAVLILVIVAILLCLSKTSNRVELRGIEYRQPVMQNVQNVGTQVEHYMWYDPSSSEFGWHETGSGPELKPTGMLDGTRDKPYMPTVPLDDEFIIKKCVGPGLHIDPNSDLCPENPFLPNDGGYLNDHFQVLPDVDLLLINPKFMMSLLKEALRTGFKSISTDTLVDKSFQDFAMGRCADLDIV